MLRTYAEGNIIEQTWSDLQKKRESTKRKYKRDVQKKERNIRVDQRKEKTIPKSIINVQRESKVKSQWIRDIIHSIPRIHRDEENAKNLNMLKRAHEKSNSKVKYDKHKIEEARKRNLPGTKMQDRQKIGWRQKGYSHPDLRS